MTNQANTTAKLIKLLARNAKSKKNTPQAREHYAAAYYYATNGGHWKLVLSYINHIRGGNKDQIKATTMAHSILGNI